MAHTLAPYFRACYFNTTLITDNPLKTDSFIFTAVTLPVLGWSKDAFAEETILFWFERTIIDGFRFRYLTIAPTTNLLRTGKADTDSVKIVYFEHAHFLSERLTRQRRGDSLVVDLYIKETSCRATP